MGQKPINKERTNERPKKLVSDPFKWLKPTTPPTKQLRGIQRIDRNKPCPCGSGVKYKKCREHLRED